MTQLSKNPPKIYKNVTLASVPSPQYAVTFSIAFYNDLRLLEFQLLSLQNQTIGKTSDTLGLQFEVLICDDGSRPEVVEALHLLIDKSPLPIKHLWHEDLGFRKNRLLNWGIFNSDSAYMVFVDQDCLPHPEFIREHYLARAKGAVLCGRRMELTPWVSSLLTAQNVAQGFIQKNLWWIILACLPFKDTNGIKGVYLKNSFLRKWMNQRPRGILGCNFSLHRGDLLAINGFDWRYEAPGTGEDSDIDYRLGLNGIKKIPMVSKAVQYHVFHKLSSRSSNNAEIFAEVVRAAKPVTAHGLTQLLQEAQISLQDMQGPIELQESLT